MVIETLGTQELSREDAYARGGHTAKTLVRTDDLRAVLVALKAGNKMAEHVVPRTATLVVVSGSVRVHAATGADAVSAGQLAVLPPNVPHDVEAVEDSTFLLTFGWDGACSE